MGQLHWAAAETTKGLDHIAGALPRYAVPCHILSQDGRHITFDCPRFEKERRELLGPRKTWESLDGKNRRKDEGDDSHWDTIEAFFDFIYNEFS